MSLALVIMDLQSAFLENEAFAKGVAGALPYVNFAAKTMRQANYPVIVVTDAEADEVGALVAGLEVDPGDLRITKKSSNAFRGTNLAAELRAHGVKGVVICGYAAEECVLRTYFGAEDEGFSPLLLTGGVISENPKHARFVLDMTHTLTTRALRLMCAGV